MPALTLPRCSYYDTNSSTTSTLRASNSMPHPPLSRTKSIHHLAAPLIVLRKALWRRQSAIGMQARSETKRPDSTTTGPVAMHHGSDGGSVPTRLALGTG